MSVVRNHKSNLSESGLRLGEPSGRTLIFLPGFLAPAGAYQEVLAPLASIGFWVVVPRLYSPRPSVLSGAFTVEQEASLAVDLAISGAASGAQVFLGGHSRGGQAAWRAARTLLGSGSAVHGLALVDPVDGSGFRSVGDYATSEATQFQPAPLIIGAGRGGKCAPSNRNHQLFAASSPGCRHVVLNEMGHADVMSGPFGWASRRLCGSGPDDGAPARAEVAELLGDYLGTCADST